MEPSELLKKVLDYCLKKKQFKVGEIVNELNLSKNDWNFCKDFLQQYSFLKHDSNNNWTFNGKVME